MKGTLALSWGKWGGFYRYRSGGEHLSTVRLCFGWLAITYVGGIEIDDLMEGYANQGLSDPEMAIISDATSVLDGLWDFQAALGQQDARGGAEYDRLALAPKLRRIIGKAQ